MLRTLLFTALLFVLWNQAVIADIPTASTKLEQIQQAELVYFSSRSPGTIDMLSFKIASVLDTCQEDFQSFCSDVRNPEDRRRISEDTQQQQEGKGVQAESTLMNGRSASHYSYIHNHPHNFHQGPPAFVQNRLKLVKQGKDKLLANEALYQKGEQPHHVNQYHVANIKDALLATRSEFYLDRDRHLRSHLSLPRSHDQSWQYNDQNEYNQHNTNPNKPTFSIFKPSHAYSPYKTTRNTPPPMGFGVNGDKCLFEKKEALSYACNKAITNLEGYMSYNLNNFYHTGEDGSSSGDSSNLEERDELRDALFRPPFYVVLMVGGILYALISCGRARKRKAALEAMLSTVWQNPALKATIEQQLPASSQPFPRPLSPEAHTWLRVRRASLVAMALLLVVGFVTVDSALYQESSEEEQELYDDKDMDTSKDNHSTKTFLHILAALLCLTSLLFIIALFKSKDMCCPNRQHSRGGPSPSSSRRHGFPNPSGDVQYIALSTFDSSSPPPSAPHHQHPQQYPQQGFYQEQQQQQQQGPVHVYSGVPVSNQPSGQMV